MVLQYEEPMSRSWSGGRGHSTIWIKCNVWCLKSKIYNIVWTLELLQSSLQSTLRTTILNSNTSDSKTSYSITSTYTQLYCTICPILEHCGIVDYSIICCGALWSGPDAVLWLNYFQNNTLVQQFLRPLIYFFIDFREDFRQQKKTGAIFCGCTYISWVSS